MYQQIKEQIRELIVSGTLQEGTLLPSIRELSADLSCSSITIRRVYQDLENEKLLVTRQGTGTFVASVDEGDRSRYRSTAVAEAFKTAVELGRRMQCAEDEMRKMVEDLLLATRKGETK
ncbi:GntR family transcriptional regulator [Paenibacillus senegalensis]|uniref:GntR family transcriptional regulator n=1 Tax=Paenibacillus senegalensis TaxID=1465766 RepID=UPI001F1E8FCA|nr:GntR family transcriptional regulator [Paenibacillus senegalensis]